MQAGIGHQAINATPTLQSPLTSGVSGASGGTTSSSNSAQEGHAQEANPLPVSPGAKLAEESEGPLRGPVVKPLALSTLCVHAGADPEAKTGAVIPPLYRSTTFAQHTPGVPVGAWDYSRAGNPTRDRLELALAALESAKYSVTYASGLAAENAIMTTLEPGDRVLVCDDVYGGTGRLFRTLHKSQTFDFIDLNNLEAVKQQFEVCKTDKGAGGGADGELGGNSPIKMVWIETPTNPLLKEIDIKAISQIAREHGALTVVDNTFATPIFQQPLSQGADMVIHSTTKYIGGHSDIIGGAVMTNNDKLHEAMRYRQFAAGAVPSPTDCDLLHRSIKTLDVRMKRHQENATQLHQFLQQHPYVDRVNYPGYSGMISFSLKGPYEGVERFLNQLQLFTLAESLGGVESLINHPAKMTHASVPEALRESLGIGPNLLRLSVGIEQADDLQNDLQQALDHCMEQYPDVESTESVG